MSAGSRPARLIAFYLPQFYPISENDSWWGKGFTEWTNVAGAQPQFRRHDQPRVPADLGFYDLRLPETRLAQAQLARSHGVEAFCYWHYWFSGRRLLERPFQEVLASSEPDFPFCLAWANQPWTRTWLGSGQVLQAQTYSPEDDVDHARWLTAAFADPRYVRVGGRPLFLVYKPTDLPDPHRTTDTLRSTCIEAGVGEPFLLAVNAFCFEKDGRSFGFDGTVDFEPQLAALPQYTTSGPKLSKLQRNLRLPIWSASLKVYDYGEARALMERARSGRTHPVYPSILVGWDNTPRRGKDAIIMTNASPERFEAGLSELVRAASSKPPEDRLVFLNAWNEWAEGNYLEPDITLGLGKLEAVRRVIGGPVA